MPPSSQTIGSSSALAASAGASSVTKTAGANSTPNGVRALTSEQPDSPTEEVPPVYFQGDRCTVRGSHKGVVQFVGDVGGLGFMVGVLLDEPVGNSNGTLNRIHYFDAPPRHGGFFPVEEVECEMLVRPLPTGAPKAKRTARGKSPSRKQRTARTARWAATARTARAQPSERTGPVTSPMNCQAAGRGLHTAIAKQRAQFVITAYDNEGRRRQRGGDKFELVVRGVLPPQNIRHRVHDHGNGCYTVTYTSDVSGQVEVAVGIGGEHIEGSPFAVQCLTLRPDPSKCVLRGEALTLAVARKQMSFEIEFVDALGQIAYAEDLDVRVEAVVEASATAEGHEGKLASIGEEEPPDPRLLEKGVLRVVLKNGRDLVAIDLNGKSDPYVVLRGGGGAREAISSIQRKTTSPVWNEEFVWAGTLGSLVEAGLQLDLRDTDNAAPRPTQDDLMGKLDVPLDGLLTAEKLEITQEVSIEGVVVEALATRGGGGGAGSEATKGVIALSVQWEPTGLEEPEEVPYDLVVGEERVVVGSKPLILRDGVNLDSNRVHGEVKLAAKATVLLLEVKETSDGVRVKLRVLSDSQREALKDKDKELGGGVCGWVTAVKDGKSRLARPHHRIHVNRRRLQQELWNKRMAADRAHTSSTAKASQLSAAGGRHNRGMALEMREKNQIGPSFEHELADTERGIGFAYGGVTPGTLHAHGNLLKTHQVHYSIGCAGRFQLHVGLRQQAATLPGSPFALVVRPGPAHAPSCALPTEALPLSSVVGEDGSRLVRLKDCMGNLCIEGGAPLRVLLSTNKVNATCEDQGDGSYLLRWRGERIGEYTLSVLLQDHHVGGSPAPLTLLPAPIDVNKCVILGERGKLAVAGTAATIEIRCQDSFGNEADPLPTQTYGLCLVGASNQRSSADRAILPREQESLAFDGLWERPHYSLTYVPTEAGDFDLHLWSDPDGSGNRVALPGSPFALHVTSGPPSASGSHVVDSNLQMPDGDAAEGEGRRTRGELVAGEKVVLRVQVRDAHGNHASLGSEGELSATINTPSGEPSAVTLKQLGGAGAGGSGSSGAQVRDKKQSAGGGSGGGQGGTVGAFEIVSAAELTVQGEHTLHVRLHDQDMSGSPIRFIVTPSAPIGSKSRLQLRGGANPSVNTPTELRLQLFDRYSNELRSGGVRVEAKAYGSKASECTIVDHENGHYTISFVAGVAGDYKMQVRVENNEIAPLTLKVLDAQSKEEAPAPTPAAAAVQIS